MTGPDGTFEMGLPASNGAEYNLVAHDGTYQQWRKWANGTLPAIRTTPGQEIEGVEIRLTRPATVSGLVVDERGKPVAYREVRSRRRQARKPLLRPHGQNQRRRHVRIAFHSSRQTIYPGRTLWMTVEQGPKDATKTVTLDAGQTVEGVKLIGHEDR